MGLHQEMKFLRYLACLDQQEDLTLILVDSVQARLVLQLPNTKTYPLSLFVYTAGILVAAQVLPTCATYLATMSS
jgi:hypothetical protein